MRLLQLLVMLALPTFALAACDSEEAETSEEQGKKKKKKKKKPDATSSVEVTTVDFTQSTDFRAANATVMGVRLGMKREEAEKILKANDKLFAYEDKSNPTRLYVNDAEDGKKGKKAYFYYIWEPGDEALARITVFKDAEALLIGDAKKLLSLDALDPKSALATKFLGKPDRTATTLDVPSIKMKHVTHYYDKLGIAVTDKENDGKHAAIFAFVNPAKAKPAGDP